AQNPDPLMSTRMSAWMAGYQLTKDPDQARQVAAVVVQYGRRLYEIDRSGMSPEEKRKAVKQEKESTAASVIKIAAQVGQLYTKSNVVKGVLIGLNEMAGGIVDVGEKKPLEVDSKTFRNLQSDPRAAGRLFRQNSELARDYDETSRLFTPMRRGQ